MGELLGAFTKILMLMMLVFIGFLFIKTKYVSKDSVPTVSSLLIKLFLPCVIASSILNPDLSVSDIKNNILYFLLAMGFVIAVLIVNYFITKLLHVDEEKFIAYYMAITFSNVIFMGLPLGIGILGEESAFFVSVVAVAQDTVFWCLAVTLIPLLSKNKNSQKRKFKLSTVTVVFIASVIIKFLPFNIPNTIYEPISFIGKATPYFAMIFIGLLLGTNTGIKNVITEWRTYVAILLKQILLPIFAGFVVFVLFGNYFSEIQKTVFVIEFSTSTLVALAPVLASYDEAADYGSSLIFVSVVSCIVTVPVIVWLSNLLFI